MKEAYASIIKAIGEDLNRPGLVGTPERAAKAMEFLTQGYKQNVDDIINDALFPTTSNEMVIVKNIELYSLCEHHLLPFIGKCHVAYLPTGMVIGLSKVARIVDMFARRLQIQEHMCMMMRGVEKQNSVMTTSCMLGAFRDRSTTRTEFLSLIR
jgi:GTP cyclohydrolase I